MAATLLTFKRYPPPQILSCPVRRKSQLDRVQRLKHGRMTIAIFRALTLGLPGGHSLFFQPVITSAVAKPFKHASKAAIERTHPTAIIDVPSVEK
jgi:hypothetical protein